MIQAEQRDVDWGDRQPQVWHVPVPVPVRAAGPSGPMTVHAPRRIRASTIDALLRDWESRVSQHEHESDSGPVLDLEREIEHELDPAWIPVNEDTYTPALFAPLPDAWIDTLAEKAEDDASSYEISPHDMLLDRLTNDVAAPLIVSADNMIETDRGIELPIVRTSHEPLTMQKHAPVTSKASCAPPPKQSVRDLFDWRTVAPSQQGVALPGHVYTHMIGERWDSETWMAKRRKPSQTLLLRTAHQAARAAGRQRQHHEPHLYPGERTLLDSRSLTLAARTYQQHWRHVLAYEREHHESEVDEQRAQPIEELIAQGVALDGLMAFWQKERHFGRRLAVFKYPGSRRLPPHKFQSGTVIYVAPDAPDTPADWYLPKRARRFTGIAAAATPAAAPRSSSSSPSRTVRIPAEVLDVTSTQMRVRFSEAYERIDLSAFDSWRIDRGESNVVNERTEAALDALLYSPADVVRAMTPEKQYALAGTELRDVLTGIASRPSPMYTYDQNADGLFANDQRIRSWYERYARDDPIRMDGDPDLGLNASQLQAVAMMLKERVSLVQGPPGTGKTRTLVQTVSLLKRHFQVPHPILLAAHTNVAVDNLAEGCVKVGLRVVRAGSSTAMRASLEPVSFDAQFQQHANYRMLCAAEKNLREQQQYRDALQEQIALAKQDSAAGLRLKLRHVCQTVTKLTAKCHLVRNRMYADVLHHADVVCTTAVAAGSSQLATIDFPVVFLDESSMATEPIALIPLMKGCAQLGLVGDHKQLPPVLHSADARHAGLSMSLFERLMRRMTVGRRGKTAGNTISATAASPAVAQDMRPIPSIMLSEQFRMHPTLSSFPNRHFYDGALKDAPSTSARQPYNSVFAARNAHGEALPLTLLTHAPVPFSTGLLARGVSPHNQPQADMVLELVCDLLERNPSLSGTEIGIVTPYEAQVCLLRKMLAAAAAAVASPATPPASFPWLSEDAMDFLAGVSIARAHELAAIEVHTVDGFEGREKPVMIFSTVKASGGSVEGTAALYRARTEPSDETAARLEHVANVRGGYVGFLADARRMNVALTRAQRQLFVVGNLETLLCARLGEGGAENVECQDVHVIRQYARWLLAHGYVVDMQDVRDRQLDAQLR